METPNTDIEQTAGSPGETAENLQAAGSPKAAERSKTAGSPEERQVVYVDDQAALESCMATLAQAPGGLLALDTEFERRKTFYPKTGLLQLADTATCYLIDPLKVSDWAPFTALLQNPALRFIIHAAGEDLNLLISTL